MNYDHHVRVYREILEPKRKHEEQFKGKPIVVNITIPYDLIRMAREYPALDWNEVMKLGVVSVPPAEAER